METEELEIKDGGGGILMHDSGEKKQIMFAVCINIRVRNKDTRQSEAAKSSSGNERDVYPRRDHVAVCLCFSPRF